MQRQLTLYRYIVHRVKKNWKNTTIMIVLISLSLFISLQTQENFYNTQYITVISQSKITSRSLDELKKISGVTYIAEVNYSKCNDHFLIFNANLDFKIFVRKYIIAGRLPENNYEISIIVERIPNETNLQIGKILRINNKTYSVVGYVDTKWIPINPTITTNNTMVLHITEEEISPTILFIGYSFYTNSTEVYNRIKNIFNQTAFVYFRSVSPIEEMYFKVVLVGMYIINIGLVFLITVDVRKDTAILYAIGWPRKWILKRFLLELILLYAVGYSLCYLFSYIYIVFITKYFIFMDVHLLAYFLGLFAVVIFSSIVFANYFYFKTGTEVLVE